MEYHFLRTESINHLELQGQFTELSLAENTSSQLWQNFRKHLKEHQILDEMLYSVQLYPEDYFSHFSFERVYKKGACILSEKGLKNVENIKITNQDYVVFHYKGSVIDFHHCLTFILTDWLPKSGYQLSNAVHFERFKPKTLPFEDDFQEEVFVPIINL